MASCGYAVIAAMRSTWSRSAVRNGVAAPAAVPDAWRRARRCWWTRCFPSNRCGCGEFGAESGNFDKRPVSRLKIVCTIWNRIKITALTMAAPNRIEKRFGDGWIENTSIRSEDRRHNPQQIRPPGASMPPRFCSLSPFRSLARHVEMPKVTCRFYAERPGQNSRHPCSRG